MNTLYLIPGTGADYRFFSKLRLNVSTKVIEWKEWGSAKTINDYAHLLSQQINTDEPFGILGVSFGGMIAVEMSKFLSPKKLILVSSAKTYKELPKTVRISNKLGARYIVSAKLIKMAPFAGRIFGVSKKDKLFFDKMLSETPEKHLKRTIQSILKWKNKTYPKSIIHIHGTNDKVIPIKNIENPIEVKFGGHFMIYNKAKEISQIVNSVVD